MKDRTNLYAHLYLGDQMSENDKPTPPNKPTDFDFSLPTVEEMQEKARQAQEALKNPPALSDKQKAILLTVGLTYVLFKIEKRMVTKVVRKDSLIIKEHLRQLTMAVEDLAEVAYDKRFATGSFLRSVRDTK